MRAQKIFKPIKSNNMESVFLMATVVPVTTMATLFGIVYLYKKENIAMIEKGMNPNNTGPAHLTTLKYALLLTGSGLGLLLAYIINIEFIPRYETDNPFLYIALVAIFGGLGLLLSYRIEKKELDKGTEERS